EMTERVSDSLSSAGIGDARCNSLIHHFWCTKFPLARPYYSGYYARIRLEHALASFSMNIGGTIRNYRRQKCSAQGAMEKGMGVSASNCSRVEHGNTSR